MKFRIVATVLAATTFVSACSSGGSSSSDSTPVVTSAPPASAEFNDADVMFAQMMIPHHEQAIEMSDIALDPTIGAGAKVADLATRIKNAQDPEITQMRNLLTSWGQSETADDSVDHSSMMQGMLTIDELDALGTLKGTAFDAEWARAMIAHHEGAVDMAEEVIAQGVNADIRTLANAIVAAQQAEIEELKSLIG